MVYFLSANLFVPDLILIKRLRQDDGNRRNNQDYLWLARKEEWIMPTKKGTTKKQKTKRDFIDFIVEASKEESTVADNFLKVLNKKDVKARELYQCLIDLGYKGVSLPGVTKMFKTYKSRPRVKKSVTEQGY